MTERKESVILILTDGFSSIMLCKITYSLVQIFIISFDQPILTHKYTTINKRNAQEIWRIYR